ncbi:hypothetical protein SPRG_01503 [Saprolegnia parasitica CBS 223.65]|uniref:CCT domain-containing protein n=1 Tax=Saprolegnia parasitica (strain CBS 223.65) TaxID=695850 RepID=A0A067D5T4_SAPPC|nr:hypothetical protein SPRG_01503 [Saprolegnia parasitica CBS 223.65]KDO34367.1 hypothetical protein SPRG_01503 [Saprolegnia parasitica CBS 223.65]|eukprot:XP_012195103.1 hypothetical protein SPRG_01503 [Saprolegnia parasitica CBS 223.65]
MMLGCYAEDPLAKQSRQQAHAHAASSGHGVGADSFVDVEKDGELGWFSDGSLLRMDEFGHDIEWVNDELDQSLHLQFAHGDSEDLFAREFAPFAVPSAATPLDVASNNQPTASDGMHLASGDFRECEKLLMSFDTMSYTSPSPISSPRRGDASLDDAMLDDDMDDDMDIDDDMSLDGDSDALSSMTDMETESLKAALAKLSPPAVTKVEHKALVAPVKKIFEPICHQRTIGAYTPAARKLRLEKFHEKRKKRIWKKSIKYDCRKKLADDRPRIKGRFVRVLENLNLVKSEEAIVVPDATVDAPVAASPKTDAALIEAPVTDAAPVGTPAGTPSPTAVSSLLGASLSPTVNAISANFGFGFGSPVVMVKLEQPPSFPLVGRAILG